MKLRWKLLFSVGVLLLAMGAAIGLRPVGEPGEPVYRGKKLSEWLLLHRQSDGLAGYDAQALAQANEAILQIGSNGIPFYLKWIAYRPPEWEMSSLSVLDSALPLSVLAEKLEPRLDWRLVCKWQTPVAFQKLKGQARGAIPGLVQMVTNSLVSAKPNEDWPAHDGLWALGCIGPEATPALAGLLTNQDVRIRRGMAVRVYAVPASMANSILPYLEKLLRDEDEVVRQNAKLSLKYIAPQLLTDPPSP